MKKLKVGEIDFVCNYPKEEKLIYLQVSYIIVSEETYNREFGALQRINDNYPKYVLSMLPLIEKTDDDGIIRINLHLFLTNGLDKKMVKRILVASRFKGEEFPKPQ